MGFPIRKEDAAAAPELSGTLRHCAACDREMFTAEEDEGRLPLHYALGKLCSGSCAPGEPPRFGQQIVAPLTIEETARLSVSEIAAADTCLACGGAKLAGYTLCNACFAALPYVYQKALPPYIKHYLFVDDRPVNGHYSRKGFMDVFQHALKELTNQRAEAKR